jgi:hypothetical protein
MSVPIGGGINTPLASGQDYPYEMAVDGTNVYWTNWGFSSGDGKVMSVPIAGGIPPTILASGYTSTDSIVVDAQSVFWTSFGDGTLTRLTPK